MQLIKRSLLPTNYTELESIDLSPAKVINTGVATYINSIWESELALTTLDGINGKYIDGYYSGGRYFMYASGTILQQSFGAVYANTTYNFNNLDKHTFRFSNDGTNVTVSCDNTLYYNATPTQAAGGTILIGAGQANGLTIRHYQKRLWRNGKLVLNLVPCKRNSDELLGYYNTIPTLDKTVLTYSVVEGSHGLIINGKYYHCTQLNDNGTGTRHYEDEYIKVYCSTDKTTYYMKAKGRVTINDTTYVDGNTIRTWNYATSVDYTVAPTRFFPVEGSSGTATAGSTHNTYISAIVATYQSRLPEDYEELEYVENMNNCNINTGSNYHTDDRIELIFGYKSFTGQYPTCFGSTQSEIYTNTAGTVVTFGAVTVSTPSLFIKDSKQLIRATITNNLTSAQAIFSYGTSGNANYFALGRAYEFKHYNSSNELIQHLIPARNSSNVIGMYDIIQNTFHAEEARDNHHLLAGPLALSQRLIATKEAI